MAGRSFLRPMVPPGILKAKQKLGVTFNSDKLGCIDFTKFSLRCTLSLILGFYLITTELQHLQGETCGWDSPSLLFERTL